jgi:crotonobetainyl-CoA:carnitine CoA-transferase CaiB-like acyl-CoA transferase
MIMGPAVGAVLHELGAEVIRIEPPGGDPTRWLPGSGAGYFPMYNRGKKSVCIDIRNAEGRQLVHELAARSDVFVENLKPGALAPLQLDYETLQALNPRLIYCAGKGFLSGPYEQRLALDEVVQMMCGLAYMTGPPGRPLRAGASVVDVMGALFGVIAILAALEQRRQTGRGQKVSSALFETGVYLMGQHMAQLAVTGEAAKPMPVRTSAWAIYDVFTTADGDQVFLGIVSDGLWLKFCEAFGLNALAADPRLRHNADRVQARAWLLPQVQTLLAGLGTEVLVARLEFAQLPFARVGRPEDLIADPHLESSGGLMRTALPTGAPALLPILPVELDGHRIFAGQTLPSIGEHTRSILGELGVSATKIDSLARAGIIGEQQRPSEPL